MKATDSHTPVYLALEQGVWGNFWSIRWQRSRQRSWQRSCMATAVKTVEVVRLDTHPRLARLTKHWPKTQWHASLDDSPKPKKKLKLDKETVEEIFNAGRNLKSKTRQVDSVDDGDGGLNTMLIKYKKSLLIRGRDHDLASIITNINGYMSAKKPESSKRILDSNSNSSDKRGDKSGDKSCHSARKNRSPCNCRRDWLWIIHRQHWQSQCRERHHEVQALVTTRCKC